MTEKFDVYSEYLTFRVIRLNPKTKVVGVFSKGNGDKLGEIKWFGRWQQYSFFPEKETVFNNQCLDDVIICLKILKETRK